MGAYLTNALLRGYGISFRDFCKPDGNKTYTLQADPKTARRSELRMMVEEDGSIYPFMVDENGHGEICSLFFIWSPSLGWQEVHLLKLRDEAKIIKKEGKARINVIGMDPQIDTSGWEPVNRDPEAMGKGLM